MRPLPSWLKQFFAYLELNSKELRMLASCRGHNAFFSRHRLSTIEHRARAVSLVFALMVPAWIPLDFLLLPSEEAEQIAVLRVISGLAFALLAMPFGRETRRARTRLILMMLVPCAFYAFVLNLALTGTHTGMAGILMGIYEQLPFVIFAGIALFPLTLKEATIVGGICFAGILLAVLGTSSPVPESFLSAGWMVLMIFLIGTLSSMFQLKHMLSLMQHVSTDSLTGALTRKAGEEILQMNFELAVVQGRPFSVVFLDLDHFKSINDDYGHDAGDVALSGATAALTRLLRRGDQVIRWGGEEFVLQLTDAGLIGARQALQKIQHEWLGTRPDGKPLTASMGVAERCADQCNTLSELIELADQRMYQAKTRGRAQAVFESLDNDQQQVA